MSAQSKKRFLISIWARLTTNHARPSIRVAHRNLFAICSGMSNEYDKQQWQAEQAARDAALEKQRDKERKARERSARNAQRKLDRLYRTLKEKGEISDFEEEFSESVGERLEEFGSAFRDLEKGRPGDALSFAQKRVVAGMNRKVKDLKKKPAQTEGDDDALQRPRYSGKSARSSFKSKKPAFTPRVRQLDEEFEPDEPEARPEPYIPERTRPPVGKPFLRVVSKD